jgi:acyl dehydratase
LTIDRGLAGRDAESRAEWFDDYAVGDVIVSPVIGVAREDVRSYSRFTNDVRPVFRSAAAMDTAPIPQLYLFSLGIAILLHGAGTYIPRHFVAFYGFDVIDFHADALIGATIKSEAVVAKLDARDRNGLITYEHVTMLEDGTPLVTSTHRILVERRPDDG